LLPGLGEVGDFLPALIGEGVLTVIIVGGVFFGDGLFRGEGVVAALGE